MNGTSHIVSFPDYPVNFLGNLHTQKSYDYTSRSIFSTSTSIHIYIYTGREIYDRKRRVSHAWRRRREGGGSQRTRRTSTTTLEMESNWRRFSFLCGCPPRWKRAWLHSGRRFSCTGWTRSVSGKRGGREGGEVGGDVERHA